MSALLIFWKGFYIPSEAFFNLNFFYRKADQIKHGLDSMRSFLVATNHQEIFLDLFQNLMPLVWRTTLKKFLAKVVTIVIFH